MSLILRLFILILNFRLHIPIPLFSSAVSPPTSSFSPFWFLVFSHSTLFQFQYPFLAQFPFSLSSILCLSLIFLSAKSSISYPPSSQPLSLSTTISISPPPPAPLSISISVPSLFRSGNDFLTKTAGRQSSTARVSTGAGAGRGGDQRQARITITTAKGVTKNLRAHGNVYATQYPLSLRSQPRPLISVPLRPPAAWLQRINSARQFGRVC